MTAAIEGLSSERLYTPEEVAEHHLKKAVSASWLVKQARLERIRARKVGRSWRFTADDIQLLFEQCVVAPKPRARQRR